MRNFEIAPAQFANFWSKPDRGPTELCILYSSLCQCHDPNHNPDPDPTL